MSLYDDAVFTAVVILILQQTLLNVMFSSGDFKFFFLLLGNILSMKIAHKQGPKKSPYIAIWGWG